MNINLMKTLKQIEKKIDCDSLSISDLHKAYALAVQLRSQLLGVIHELETFCREPGVSRLADLSSAGVFGNDSIILTINEPLPPTKELTGAMEDHWLDLIHTAIGRAAKEQELPYFKKAFVWIEVITPKYTDNAKLWDTSNRAINLIINNLKGTFFEDDNHEHMAFGVVGRWGEKSATIVHVLPVEKLERIMAPYLTASP